MQVLSRKTRGPGRRLGTRPSGGGFTLTELTVIMLVMVILIGMAMPSLSGLNSSRQNVAATRIRTMLAFAQRWAMGSSNDTWVSFNVSSNLISVYVEDPGNPGKAGRLAMPDPLTRTAMTLQLGTEGTGIDSATFGVTTEVQFDSTGTPYDAGGSILAADGTVGLPGSLTVRVTKVTGLVTVD